MFISTKSNAKAKICFVTVVFFSLAILFVNSTGVSQEVTQKKIANNKTLEKRSAVELIKQAKPSIVHITFTDRDGVEAGVGTGFVISKDGLIATNLHVISESRPINVQLQDGTKKSVKSVHAFDRSLDLAIIKIDADNLSPLSLEKDREADQGEQVIALGHPHDLKNSAVTGIVSAFREVDGMPMYQIAMPIEPGNSGGPLMGSDGKVIGVVTMKSAVTENLGFAVDARLLQGLLKRPSPIPLERWIKIAQLDPKRWEVKFDGRWRRKSGKIFVDGNGGGTGGRTICISRQKVPDKLPYEIGVSVKMDDESGAAGIIFACDEEDRHFGFYPSNGSIRLTRFAGPTVFQWKVIRELEADSYLFGTWNHLKVRFEKDRFVCFVNDTKITEYSYSEPPSGRVGLAKFRDTIAEFKNFEIAEKVGSYTITPLVQKRMDLLIEQLPPLANSAAKNIDQFSDEYSEAIFMLNRNAKRLEARAEQLRSYANDVHIQSIVKKLEKQIKGKSENEIDLFHSALLICQLDHRDLILDPYFQTAETMSTALKDRMKASKNTEQKT